MNAATACSTVGRDGSVSLGAVGAEYSTGADRRARALPEHCEIAGGFKIPRFFGREKFRGRQANTFPVQRTDDENRAVCTLASAGPLVPFVARAGRLVALLD